MSQKPKSIREFPDATPAPLPKLKKVEGTGTAPSTDPAPSTEAVAPKIPSIRPVPVSIATIKPSPRSPSPEASPAPVFRSPGGPPITARREQTSRQGIFRPETATPNVSGSTTPTSFPRIEDLEEEKTDPGIIVASDPNGTPIAGRMPELGSLKKLMDDPNITEIMINDVRNIMIEKNGNISYAGFSITEIDELNRMVRNILDTTGRIVSPDQPYVDVMLPDGSRVNIVVPPITLRGPCITIRKHPFRRALSTLIDSQSMSPNMAEFLKLCAVGKINILISGGTGSGKTTLLNALTEFIPRNERIVTIEDTPELSLRHDNSVSMQTKPASPGSNAIEARDLVANSLRMRPDRVILGECRRGEAFDMLQAMNTGHEGSMTTIHANAPRDSLARLETLCLQGQPQLPLQAIRRQVTGAIDLIVQTDRLRGGSRKITAIHELVGMEGETYTMQEIFLWDTEQERHRSAGFIPTFLAKLAERGVVIPHEIFS